MVAVKEVDRQRALDSCGILDTPPDPELDALVERAARLTQAPMALITLIDNDRQWFKAKHGLQGTETPRETSFCSHTIQHTEPLIVSDARADVRFAKNPHVLGDPNVVFYAGWPLLTHDGHALGALCVIDRVPRELTDNQRETMAKLAKQTMLSIELHRAVARGTMPPLEPVGELLAAHGKLHQQESARAELAQLVVHDLKNPLTAIVANATMVLESGKLDDDEREMLEDVLAASARMQSMLIDLLDVGLGADSIMTARRETIDAVALVGGAVRECGRAEREGARVRVKSCESAISMYADPNLVNRVVANLVTNALRFAPAGSDVTVTIARTWGGVQISVADLGRGIADPDKRRVFEKYVQLSSSGRSTRGLGLAFCRLACLAHDGRIWVEDNRPNGAVFHVLIPTPPDSK